jgi:hypothetical protein
MRALALMSLQDLEEAGVIEWAVVVATALLDLRAVTRLLREYHELCPAFHAMFASLSWFVSPCTSARRSGPHHRPLCLSG